MEESRVGDYNLMVIRFLFVMMKSVETNSQHCECNEWQWIVSLKMVLKINFMLCIFYHKKNYLKHMQSHREHAGGGQKDTGRCIHLQIIRSLQFSVNKMVFLVIPFDHHNNLWGRQDRYC